MPTLKTITSRAKVKIPAFRELIIISCILVFVVMLETITDIEQAVIIWFYNNKDTVLKEIAVNSIIACILFCIYSMRRIREYKRLIKKQSTTEARLQSSQQQLEMILNNSSTIVYTADSAGNSGNTYISGNVTSILGYQPEDFYQSNFWMNIIHADDLPKVLASMPAFLEKGFWEDEFRVKHKNGAWHWMFNQIQVIRDENGAPKELVGSWLDITERKKAQETIRKSEGRFQLAAKASKDVIYDWDLQTNTIWVNDQHYLVFGYAKESNTIVGIEWWETKLHPDDHDAVLNSLAKAIEEKKDAWSAEYRLRRANGTYAYVLDRALISYSPGSEPVHCIGTMTDLSELKLAETELREAKENAEESTKAKSEFLANMSHEIRTPLNGIVGMTDMVLETTDLSSVQRRYLNIVKSSSETLMSLINDILDFSKIDAGKLDLSPVPFSLRNEIPKALQVLGLKASEKKLEFIYRLEHNVPDNLVGDVLRLQQIIINLAGNAIKFTEKGEVMLRVQLQSIMNNKAVLHFTVSDSGIGIPADKLSAIFDEFSQVDSSTSRKYGGTGLGLAITKRLVQMMDGSIWVESKEGEGSTFHFTVGLPIQAGKDLSRFIPGQALENVPILVVQDNKSTRNYIADILTHFGMKPAAVANGEDAVRELKRAVLNKNPYPVVLLDIALPGQMDGFDVAASIKGDQALKDTEIIVISMSQKASDRQRFSLLGVSEFFSKPFSQSDLHDSIQNILVGNKGLLEQVYTNSGYAKNTNSLFSVSGKGNLKILLAEDNKVNQEVALSMLTSHGYEVNIANNGEEAICAIQKESYDLIIMDVQMPVMNGFEATNKIRQIEKQTRRHIPIIGLTANAMNGDRQKCIDAGMDDYLSKPVSMKNLLAAVAKLHNGQLALLYEGHQNSAPVNFKVDVEELFRKLGGSKKVVSTCMNLFNDEIPALSKQIEMALNNMNDEEIKTVCHGLRSALVTMEMHAAGAIAFKIETFAEEKKFQEIQNLLPLLKNEIKEAVDYIGSLL